MRANLSKYLLTAAVLVTCATSLPRAWGLVQYRLTDLGTLGGDWSAAADINASGQVVGTSYTASGEVAFLYDGTMHNLGTFGTGNNCSPNSINDGGQIAGAMRGPTGSIAFRYDGTLQTLGFPAGVNSFAGAINNSGQIACCADSGRGTESHAYLYDGTIHDLGMPAGWTSASGGCINSSGQIVGSGYTNEHAMRAFLYDGTMHELGTLGGTVSAACAINDRGQVVGYSSTSGDNASHAFLYDGTMHDLGTINGSPSTLACDINASGQVVGIVDVGGTSHGFIYDDGQMKDLNSLLAPGAAGYTVTYVNGINAAGQIVGQCTKSFVFGYHAALLTPTLATQVTSQTPTPQLCTLPVTSAPPLHGTNSFYVTPSAVGGNVLTQGHVTVDLEQVQQLDPATSLSSTVLTPKITLLKQSPSYAWVPLTIPEGADALTLSFTFRGIDPADFLTIGINDTLLFGEEGKFVIDGAVNSTGSLDVSQWAGQDVTLFLGLNSTGGTPGGTMVIDAMQFQELPEPASLSLLAFGALGLLARRARRG